MSSGYYLFSCNMVNRSSSSAVAMASYRSGESLYSERDGETKRFKEREIQPQSFILKPTHAPEWALDRERLWNEVERYESRENAQIARNVLIGLPNDFTEEQQLELTMEYVQENFVDEGMVADVSIHRDEKDNPHAHILLTTREFNEDGEWNKSKSKRVPVLDENGEQKLNEKGWKMTRSIKVNDWDRKETLVKWRENWAEKLNEKSLQFESERKYSHESYVKQGKLEKATERLSRNDYQYEQRVKKESLEKGIEYKPVTYFAKKNERIKEYNSTLNNVIHLKDYKANKTIKNDLDNYRKSIHKDPKTIEATNLLIKRVKGYVDYGVALKLKNEFNDNRNKWSVKLQTEKTKLNVEERFFKHVLTSYKENAKSIEKYGYNQDNFQEEITKDVKELKERQSKFDAQYGQFKELKEASNLSYNYQEYLLNEEFKMLYGESQLNEFSNIEKYFAIELLKKHDILLPEELIKEEYITRSKDFDNITNLVPTWKQAKDTLSSIRIYERTINKISRSDLTQIEDPKSAIIKAKTFTDLKADYESYLESIEPILDHDIKSKGFNIYFHELNIESKVAILEEYSLLSKDEIQNLNHAELLQDIYDKQEVLNNEVQAQYNQNNTHNSNEKENEVYSDLLNRSKQIMNCMLNAITQEHQHANQSSNSRSRMKKQIRQRGADGREL